MVPAFSEKPRWRQRSDAEITAISLVAECLRDLERRPALADSQLALLAQAIDALELGAYDAAGALAQQAQSHRLAAAEIEEPRDRAHALVQALALDQLSGKLMRLAAGLDPGLLRR